MDFAQKTIFCHETGSAELMFYQSEPRMTGLCSTALSSLFLLHTATSHHSFRI